jgi:DNA-binding protein YbaB
MSEDDKEMLEAVIASAVNDAVRKIEKNSQDKMGNMTAGMNLPAGMKLPF